jgi:hypothetical protein
VLAWPVAEPRKTDQKWRKALIYMAFLLLNH